MQQFLALQRQQAHDELEGYMAELKIEKDIPIPTTPNNRGYTNAIRNLRIGESVLIPSKSVSSIVYQSGMAAKVVRRTVEGGVRVWRTK